VPDEPTNTAPPVVDPTNPQPLDEGTHDFLEPTADPLAKPTGACERPVAPLALPGYELLEKVGAGGMGVVYRAREIALDRDVAIKLLRDPVGPDSPPARRFLEEARITSRLQHPAIPPVHHVGALADGRPFLAMKLIRGQTLSRLLETGPANRGRFVPAFAQVCQAVAFAHARNIIHRDLKPANIMVGEFGEVQVMDWGLAKALGFEPAAGTDEPAEIPWARDADLVTGAGSVLGTPAYMSPEQADGEIARVDKRSDVFGLGAVLCAILTGEPPYARGQSATVCLQAIYAATGDAFARLDACGADPELVALCKQCLSADRESRPRDAGEVAEAVTAHLAAAEERARRAELERVRAGEQRKRRRVQRTLAATALGLITAAGIGTALAALWHRAEGARGTAETERHEAEIARTAAETARDREGLLRGVLARVEYGRTMLVVQQACRDRNFVAARALLDETRPDLRGWEWHYLHRLSHSDLLTLNEYTQWAWYSPDGTRLITVSETEVKIRDAETGAVLRTFKPHLGPVDGAALSSDGSRIATVSNLSVPSEVTVWDTATGNKRLTLAPPGRVHSVSFSPDGSWIVTASEVPMEPDPNGRVDPLAPYVTAGDGIVKVWTATTGREKFAVRAHAGHILPVSYSPDGSQILTAGSDGTAKVWDANTGAFLRALGEHTGAVRWASFSPDGARIITVSDDLTKHRPVGDDGAPTLAPPDDAVKIWNAKTGAFERCLEGHTGHVPVASFCSDGARVVTASFDGTAKVWDAKTGRELLTLQGHTRDVRWVAFRPDGARVVTTSGDGTLKIWNANVDPAFLTFKAPAARAKTPFVLDSVSSASFDPAGARLVTANSDGTVRVWDANTGALLLTFKAHERAANSASFGPDGARIITAGDDEAKIWNAKTGALEHTLTGHTDYVASASFGRDGARVVTAGHDGTVRIWDAKTGEAKLTIRAHTRPVHAASFGSDGARILSASYDGTVKIWDAKTGAERLALGAETYPNGDPRPVPAAAFSPDGARFVTAHFDKTARVWDAKTGNLLLTLKGHVVPLYSVSFGPDGSRIVTSAPDGVKLWDAESGTEVLAFTGPDSGSGASFSPDGSRIVTASSARARVWDMRPVNREFLPKRPAAP
jgi:WD40 repeat protein